MCIDRWAPIVIIVSRWIVHHLFLISLIKGVYLFNFCRIFLRKSIVGVCKFDELDLEVGI